MAGLESGFTDPTTGYAAPTGEPAPRENFLQRQRRLYGTKVADSGQNTGAQATNNGTFNNAVSPNSPVSSDGRIAPPSPPAAQAAAAPPMPAAPVPAPPAAMAAAPAPAAPAAPGPAYVPPAPGTTTGIQNNLLAHLFANPYSMSDQNVAQLQAAQREAAVNMALQQSQANAQAHAASGTSGGGAADLANRRINDNLMSSVLSGDRDVALQKMTQDRQDEMGLAGLGLQNDQLALQRQLGMGGLDLDKNRLGESSRQFDLTHGLDINKFFEQQRESNNQLGLSTAQLQTQAQQSLFDWLTRNYGQ